MKADWLLEDKQKRNIQFEFLEVPEFFINETSREIDFQKLEVEIRRINPRMTFVVICHSHILDLKHWLEESGIFPEMRMQRDINLISKGQILTLDELQKDFIRTMAKEENIEKDVMITGPVGSGKTMLAIEVGIMKLYHYKKKYNLSRSDCKKLRLVFNVHEDYIFGIPTNYGSQLRQGLERNLEEIHTV